MIDMDQFQNGAAGITVQYFARDPRPGTLTDFTCDAGDCSTNCVPDAVTVSVTAYQFTRFSAFFRLPAVPLPDLHASVPMGGAGCDETGTACHEESIDVKSPSEPPMSSPLALWSPRATNISGKWFATTSSIFPNTKVISEYQEVAPNLYIRVLQDLERHAAGRPDHRPLGRYRGRRQGAREDQAGGAGSVRDGVATITPMARR